MVAHQVSPAGKYINHPNFYTIGIEHEGFPDDEWPDAQYQVSHAMIDEIRARFNTITADRNHMGVDPVLTCKIN